MDPQPGIFAVGATEHAYLELDLADTAAPAALVAALAALAGPETPLSGVGLVVGFRPELWAEVAPEAAPERVSSFRAIGGPGLTMPATQHDAWLWIAAGSRSAAFDATLACVDALEGSAVVASELNGWVYRQSRDLTGFIDGTENPSVLEAADVAVARGGPGDGSSVLLFQRWRHLASFRALGVAAQEAVIGRTKDDSTELAEDVMPADSHVARTVVEEDGDELRIYRRNTAYGGPGDHGTVFVGFCASARPLQVMLERMAGVGDGVRDALTRHTVPLSGAYYVVPPLQALRARAGIG